MNEQIEYIFDQALEEFKAENKHVTVVVPVPLQRDFVEKFAKLIVRECIEQGDTLAKHYIDTHPEQEQAMLLASIADYSNEIKKHFGVEE